MWFLFSKDLPLLLESFAKGNLKIKNKGLMETKAVKYLDQEEKIPQSGE